MSEAQEQIPEGINDLPDPSAFVQPDDYEQIGRASCRERV